MKRLIIIIALIFAVTATVITANAESDADKASDCSTYARNRSESEVSVGGDTLSKGLRGASRGALFGAIVGDRKSSKRGAALAGGLGAIRGGLGATKKREALFKKYYDACMRDEL